MNLKKIDYFHISINILCVIVLLLFSAHIFTPLIDVGREMYYAKQILQGEIFIKDLSSLFSPLSYFLNAFLLFVFGDNLNTFYFFGFINALFYINAIYLVSRCFCNKITSFSVAFLSMVVSLATFSLMNFRFPYSWALTYGVVAFLYSIYCLIKFYKNKNEKFFYGAVVLASLACAFKYEFILFGILVFVLCLKNKKWLASVIVFMPLVLSYGFLFFQGVRFDDLTEHFLLIKKMATNWYSKYFYLTTGIRFSLRTLYLSLSSFLKIGFFSFVLIKIQKIKKLLLKIVLYCIVCVLAWFIYNNSGYLILIYSYASILLAILFLFNFKKLQIISRIVIFSFLTILVKNFWGLFLNGYGNYFIPIAILGLAVLFSELNKNNINKVIPIILLSSSVLILNYNLQTYFDMNHKIKSSKGFIYTDKITAENTNKLLAYINTNTKTNDTIIVAPMGHTINFLTDRKTSGKYNYFSPEYLASYGENGVVSYYMSDKPEYFILTSQDTSSYTLAYICKDYGFKLCEFIDKNYTRVELPQEVPKNPVSIYYKLYKLNE